MSAVVKDNITAFASAALPAAGAFTTTGVEIDCNGYQLANFFFTYTRGGAAGSVDYAFDFSVDGSTWIQQVYKINSASFSAGTDYRANVQRYEALYTATSANAEYWTDEVDGLHAVKIRIRAKEVGNTGAPGTLAVTCRLTRTDMNDAG